jgi:hypothetical protein
VHKSLICAAAILIMTFAAMPLLEAQKTATSSGNR